MPGIGGLLEFKKRDVCLQSHFVNNEVVPRSSARFWIIDFHFQKTFRWLFQLVVVIHLCACAVEERLIPWNSASLNDTNVFTVKLGELLLFELCGDSNGTKLIYTDSQEVFNRSGNCHCKKIFGNHLEGRKLNYRNIFFDV